MMDSPSNFRIMANGSVKSTTRTVMPPIYPCQAPGCGRTSSTVACPDHLAMLPLRVQGSLTSALATGEASTYGPAMAEAMRIWTQISQKDA